MSEEATKSRALRRNIAIWLVAAVLLGIAAGYFGGFPAGNLLRLVGLGCSWVVVFSRPKPSRLPTLLLASGLHILAAFAALYVFHLR